MKVFVRKGSGTSCFMLRDYKLMGRLTTQGNFVETQIYHPGTSLLSISLNDLVLEEKHLPLGSKEEVDWLYEEAYYIVSGMLFNREVMPQDYCQVSGPFVLRPLHQMFCSEHTGHPTLIYFYPIY